MSKLKKRSTYDLVQDYFDSRTEIGMALVTKAVDDEHKKILEAAIRKNELYMEAIALELESRGEMGRILV